LTEIELLKEIENEILTISKEINSFSSKEERQNFFKKQRDIYLRNYISWIKDNLNLLISNSIEGKDLKFRSIDPYLEIVANQEDIKIFRLFRFLSTYPFTEPVGRRIKFFIRDKGQDNKPIMGIGCISSPVINLKVRDDYIGWSANDKNKRNKLKNIVELSCAVAIPPYNELCAGKLIALSVLSSEMTNLYKNKYNDPNSYVLVSGSGLYGKNCTIFKRLKIDNHKVYFYIGETKGFTHIHINQEIYSKIEKIADFFQVNYQKGGGFYTNRKLKNLEKVFYKMDVPYRKLLILALKKAIFLGFTASNHKNFLLGKDKSANFLDYKLDFLFDYWKNRWMKMRLSNKNVNIKIRNFKIDTHLKSLLNIANN